MWHNWWSDKLCFYFETYLPTYLPMLKFERANLHYIRFVVILDSANLEMQTHLCHHLSQNKRNCRVPIDPQPGVIGSIAHIRCAEIVYTDWLLQGMWLVLTNQSAQFQQSVTTPCKNWAAAIAPWCHLCLSYCGRGFESQANYLS